LSFHKPEFHETKSERKFYEDKKQKALRIIDDFIRNIERSDSGMRSQSNIVGGLKRVRRSVNDI